MKTPRRIRKKKLKNDPVAVASHLVDLMEERGFKTQTQQGFYSVSVDVFQGSMYVTPGSSVMSDGIIVTGNEHTKVKPKSAKF